MWRNGPSAPSSLVRMSPAATDVPAARTPTRGVAAVPRPVPVIKHCADVSRSPDATVPRQAVDVVQDVTVEDAGLRIAAKCRSNTTRPPRSEDRQGRREARRLVADDAAAGIGIEHHRTIVRTGHPKPSATRTAGDHRRITTMRRRTGRDTQ